MHQTTHTTTNRNGARWVLVDASQEILGRMSSRVAQLLMGKHRPDYTPHADMGDFVVVINAADVQVTGRKSTDKIYHRHTRFPGGLVATPYPKMREKHPDEMVRLAVRRMLPKTTLGKHMLTKLKVYPGKDHPHAAQNPEAISLGTAERGSRNVLKVNMGRVSDRATAKASEKAPAKGAPKSGSAKGGSAKSKE